MVYHHLLRLRARAEGRTVEAEAVALLEGILRPGRMPGLYTGPQAWDVNPIGRGVLILDLPVALVHLLARLAEQDYRTVSGAAVVVLSAVLRHGQEGKGASTKKSRLHGRPRKPK
jgi:hypothetical protein